MEENNEVEYNDWFITDAPKSIDDVYDQDTIKRSLKTQMKNRSFGKTTFFQGGFGSGKTVFAKILAKSMACKHVDANGNPCNSCPTCLEVNNETYRRDVVYMNATEESADDVRKKLDLVMMAPAVRDACKVVICDEAQALSKEAVEAFLIATQSPKKNIFFIFTAMDKLQGPKAGALESRSKLWRMKMPTFDEIYMYLANVSKMKKLIENKEVPETFWGPGLRFIAENSEYSFRKAIQYLQQCYEGSIFTVDEMKSTFNITSNEDATKMLIDVANGTLSEVVWDTLNGMDYQDKFPLLLLVIGEAQQYRAFGNTFVESSDAWRWKQKAQLAAAPYFEDLRDGFMELANKAYIKRGEFKIIMSKIIEKANKAAKSSSIQMSTPDIGATSVRGTRRRPVSD